MVTALMYDNVIRNHLACKRHAWNRWGAPCEVVEYRVEPFADRLGTVGDPTRAGKFGTTVGTTGQGSQPARVGC